MKCPKCQNEEIFFTEEIGTFTRETKKSKLHIVLFVLSIIFVAATYFAPFKLLGNYQDTSISIAIFIFVVMIIVEIYQSFDKKRWRKHSRTKLTCTNCMNQWYVNPNEKEVV